MIAFIKLQFVQKKKKKKNNSVGRPHYLTNSYLFKIKCKHII